MWGTFKYALGGVLFPEISSLSTTSHLGSCKEGMVQLLISYSMVITFSITEMSLLRSNYVSTAVWLCVLYSTLYSTVKHSFPINLLYLSIYGMHLYFTFRKTFFWEQILNELFWKYDQFYSIYYQCFLCFDKKLLSN